MLLSLVKTVFWRFCFEIKVLLEGFYFEMCLFFSILLADMIYFGDMLTKKNAFYRTKLFFCRL